MKFTHHYLSVLMQTRKRLQCLGLSLSPCHIPDMDWNFSVMGSSDKYLICGYL